jgi:co-chaperonin GroES (HSP10)|tara:strand:- start:1 stop:258 length:258 start_codon:yes stop_codon:yes gene_type:complete
MKAVGNYLLVEKIEKKTTKTEGGLLLSENDRDDIRYIKAKIVNAGDHSFIKKDDEIFYDKHASHNIEHNGVKLQVIKVQDIVVVL